ncbi:hypothetical protein [Humibacter albus]|jgi:hypothetical protein|uniref:hypothetical protein n=1 Tax=Humibacter albus TaxID=427754 RepID=UPI0003B55012|nr:hypothetical protein [Humibacter albus]
MVRRLLPVLLAALVAAAGFGLTPAAATTATATTATSLLLAVALTAAIAVAVVQLVATASARTRAVRVSSARDAWLESTVESSPTHADVRALMRPRPPSLAL